MRNIKYSTADGVIRTAKIQKGPSPQEFTHREVWRSAPVLKARILRQGFKLVGKRQG